MAKRRKRGEGSVHLRKDGRWEGRVVVGYDDKGLPITKNVLGKTKTECTDKLKKLRESCSSQPSEKLRSDILFRDWLDFWYQNYSKPRLRPKTQMDYENNIYQHIIPALGGYPPKQTDLERSSAILRADEERWTIEPHRYLW